MSVDGQVGAPLIGVPAVYHAGQGGLFDVVLHPDFERNRLVYLCFAEGTPDDNGTAIARGEYRDGGLSGVTAIFRNFTRKDTAVHYGGRMAFLPDGTLLLTTGDGFDYREAAQDVNSGLGKVLRMTGGEGVDLVIDGGYCGMEPTTVVDLADETPMILRVGKGDPAHMVQPAG